MNKPSEQSTIRSFTDLKAWQEGHSLALGVYRAVKSFPKEEIYSLTNQMCRAAISVTSNIAEGFGRQTYKEKIQFYYMSQGSLTELKNQILLARDLGYLEKQTFDELAVVANNAHKLLQGLIKKLKEILKS